ncbi:MAG: hypothetical protein ABIP64_18250 [Burkholderiales bacterium]
MQKAIALSTVWSLPEASPRLAAGGVCLVKRAGIGFWGDALKFL